MAIHQSVLGDARDLLLLPVVYLVCAFAGEGYFLLGDLQLSILDDELHVLKVVVGVLKVGCLQLHVVGAGIRSGNTVGATEGKVILRVLVVVDAYGVSRHLLLSAVILVSTAVLRDSYNNLIGVFRNGQFTRLLSYLVILGNIVALGILDHNIAAEFTVIFAYIGALCNVGKASVFVTRNQSILCDFGDLLFTTIVDFRCSLTGKCNRFRRNFQGISRLKGRIFIRSRLYRNFLFAHICDGRSFCCPFFIADLVVQGVLHAAFCFHAWRLTVRRSVIYPFTTVRRHLRPQCRHFVGMGSIRIHVNGISRLGDDRLAFIVLVLPADESVSGLGEAHVSGVFQCYAAVILQCNGLIISGSRSGSVCQCSVCRLLSPLRS